MYKRQSFALPVLAAVASIISLPPVNVTALGFVALIPLYIFIFNTSSFYKTIFGVAIYGLICSGYTTAVTIGGFSWINEAVLFSWFMNTVGVAIVMMATIIFTLWASSIWLLKSKLLSASTWWMRISLFMTFAGVDALISQILYGFNYGSFVYVAVELAAALPSQLSSYSAGWYVMGVVAINGILAEAIQTQPWKRKQVAACICGVLVVGLLNTIFSANTALPILENTNFKIAIIQDPTTNTEIGFGKIIDRQFSFPRLEAQLANLSAQNLDMIIYPFNPWSGVLGESSDDNLIFDRQIITITNQRFRAWLKEHVPPEVIFVTWYTRYTEGQFFNEVVYWQDGEVIATYQKANLFPFFDYTPTWAQNIGLNSTPIDATPGLATTTIKIDGIVFGNAICSEITNSSHIAQQLDQSDLLLSIGSEAMFSNEIPSTFNAAKARLYAIQHQKTIIRATRSGPSVVFDAEGNLVAGAAYGEETNLIFELPTISVK
jgi:apolipoprotein N-acyltransferase